MKILVHLDRDSITVQTNRHPGLPAGLLATAVATAVERAITTTLAPTTPVAGPGQVEPGQVEPGAAALRERALRMLDEGTGDAAVCTALGISPGRLRRWDGDLRGDDRVERLEAASATTGASAVRSARSPRDRRRWEASW